MNEKGYIFPVVLVFCLIISMLTAHQLFMYLGERQFLADQKHRFQLDQMIEKTSRETFHALKQNNEPPGRFDFNEGAVDCQLIKSNLPVIQITLSASLKNLQTKSVIIYYNSETKKITKWVEGTS
ncbi:competence type IV pilus minor pilin ComGG [Fictibacillus fluitans]|uniref:Competence type IV pilus minor pilin ComGG n=1 Tax=Fictibacillus fluitans TaxID=3058422 RepID=A0ABT8HWZ9_9BACL|nr:competence type IV pilus minor pilin ComGG [Fictibacillus sp. NE201]MDN4525301.1 competence type IV pilus minor pilin ComGG [Fictibacillus sp. NE201]